MNERAKIIRELDAKYNALVEKKVNQAWDEALEKAAEEADEHNGCTDNECFQRNCPVVIANRIRSLKNNPAETTGAIPGQTRQKL